MSHNVFSNTSQVAGKAGSNKSIARFPDVCMSPPSPPAGPIPIPYPDTSMSSDLKKGSKTVKLGGKPACLAQQSHYKPSALGNEAATKSFGASVVTHVITGKTVFQSWSMDVKFEGKNVCRHIDLTTSNHNCPPPATPPLPTAEAMNVPASIAAVVDEGKCPCCGEDLHPWQKDASGNAFEPIPEEDFWNAKVAKLHEKAAGMTGKKQAQMTKFANKMDGMKNDLLAAKAEERAKKARGEPACLNVHKEDGSGCGTFLNVPADATSTYPSSDQSGSTDGQPVMTVKTTAQVQKRFFDSTAALQNWADVQPDAGNKTKVQTATGKGKVMNHITPGLAGGCNNPANVVPGVFMDQEPCNSIESWQSKLEKM